MTLVGDRFEIERLAGVGGMGTVYRAVDRSNGAPVALKITRSTDPRLAARFGREASILSGLDHPAIVRFIGAGATAEGALYIAMDWVDGESLAGRLARGRLTVAETLLVGRRLADALGAAHARGIVHRDVKPANIILPGGELQRCVLVDFGAAFGSAGQRLTATGHLIGTPAYMSPEQCRGQRNVDARTDVFALGAVLHECLTGVRAFSGTFVHAVIAKVLFEEAPRVAESCPEAPAALDALVARMLAKDPAERPASGRDVVTALDDVDRGLATVGGAALTLRERRLASVVLVAHPDSSVFDSTVDEEEDGFEPTVAVLREAAPRSGAVLEVLPDGSMIAVFTASGDVKDLVLRAAHFALLAHGLLPTASVGVATGRAMVVGALPVGELVDAVSQLVAAPYGQGAVHVDEATEGLLDARFEIVGGALLREKPPEALRLLLGRPTPCVGRESELTVLEGTFAQCVEEREARAVLLMGAPGVGKSRIVAELLRRLEQGESRPEVWHGHGEPLGAGSPYGVLARATRRRLGLVEGEPLRVQQDKITARVAAVVPEAQRARVEEFLAELAGAAFPGERSVYLRAARQDPLLMGDQMANAWTDWLAAECRARPTVLVLDDLQWGDAPTMKLLAAGLPELGDLPLLIVAAARPEARDILGGLWSDARAHVLQIGPLSPPACERLARAALGDGLERALVERLTELSGGNAFYLEELIRAVARGRTPDALPDTVLAMAQARIESLPGEARRVLRAASIFGQAFPAAGLSALVPADVVARWLPLLVDQELIVERGPARAGGKEHQFRSPLLREGAYATLTEADRRLGHGVAGAWLDRMGEAEPLVMAEHHERGGDLARAAAYYRRAAEDALGAHDLENALLRGERGLACGAAGEVRGGLLLVQAVAHGYRGEIAEAEQKSLAAMGLLSPGGAAWAQAAGEAAAASGKLGHREVLADIVRALRAPDGAPLPPQHVVAAARAAMQCIALRELEAGVELLGRTRAAVAELGDEPAASAWYHSAMAFHKNLRAEHEEAAQESEAAVAGFTRAGDRKAACVQRLELGRDLVDLGELDEAERVLRGFLAEADAMSLYSTALLGRGILALALSAARRPGEAIAVGEEGIRRAGPTERFIERQPRVAAALLASLGAAHFAAGDLDAAERRIGQSVACRAEGPPTVLALSQLACIKLARGEVTAALAIARDALAMTSPQRALCEQHARLALAEALHAAGDQPAAREAIAAARAWVQDHAALIRDPARRARFLGVPVNARILARASEWLTS